MNLELLIMARPNYGLSAVVPEVSRIIFIFWDSFDVLTNFPFTTSETMRDYDLHKCYTRVVSRVAEQLKTYDLRKLGNIRKVSKPHEMIA